MLGHFFRISLLDIVVMNKCSRLR